MSVLSRYVVKEAALHTGAGFAIVLGVFLVTRLATMLEDVVAGAVPGSVVAELLALRTLMALPSLLPAVLYLGVLLGLNRLSHDREITAMEACGVSPQRLHAAVLVMAAAVAIGIAFLSFIGRPWAAGRFDEVRERAIAEAGLENVTPGVFCEIGSSGDSMLFAESRAVLDPKYLENVFVRQKTPEGLTVFSAQRATETRDRVAGYRFLTLIDGMQYEFDPAGKHQNITHYEKYTLRIALTPPDAEAGSEKGLTNAMLLSSDDPEARAEFEWRSALPVSAFLLTVLALTLSRNDSRQSRYANVFPALLLYFIYRALLGTAKSWVAEGKLAPFPGIWLVHAGFLLLTLLLPLRHRFAFGHRLAGLFKLPVL